MNTSKKLFVLALSGLTLSATAQEEDSRLFGFFDSLRISQQTLYRAELSFDLKNH